MEKLEGIPASDGIAIGPAQIYHPLPVVAGQRDITDVEAELSRLRWAILEAKKQLDEIQQDAEATIGSEVAGVFQAQQLMLEDPDLLQMVEAHIRSGTNAEAALAQQVDHYATKLANLENPYLRERAVDLRDVGQRVLRILTGVEENTLLDLTAPAVLVASDLTPSETAQMNRDLVRGFITARGGATSHTAILARSLGLPAVVGVGEDLLEAIQQDMAIIVDGHTGIVIADPDQAILDVYLRRQDSEHLEREEARSAALVPAFTKDGQRITVAANIGNAESVETALAHGAEAIGLVRTEFLFLDRASWPDEEEQYAAYRAIAQAMGSRSVVFRTLDAGGDKPLPYMDIPEDTNPFLGLRAIRLSLAQPDRLRTQLCALLRAGVGCNVKIMFPMISTVEEIRSAQLVLEEARAELRIRGIASVDRIEIGIMVEVPSAAICASALAQEVDFFSIGTNDLIQYTLAADRTNERVGYLYDPLNPGVLHLIKRAIDAAYQASRWVGLCGEMASDLDALPLLLGMGLDELSMNAADIPKVKATIRSLDARTAQDLVTQALQLPTAAEIRALVRQYRPEQHP